MPTVMMYWYGHGMGAWGYALVTLSTVLFWAVLIAAIVALFRYFGRRPRAQGEVQPGRPTPEQLLAERFARGEIDDNAYRQALDTLRRSHSSPSGGA